MRYKNILVEAKLEMETGLQQIRRNQATAVILFGVIGADFPDELNRVCNIEIYSNFLF